MQGVTTRGALDMNNVLLYILLERLSMNVSSRQILSVHLQ